MTLQRFEYLGGMALDLDLRPHLRHDAVLDEERRPLDPERLFAVHVLLDDYSEGVANRGVDVGEELERHIIFGLEAGLGGHRVPAHPNDRHALLGKRTIQLAELDRFVRAARGVRPRVEIDDQRLLRKVAEANFRSGIVLGGDIGYPHSGLQHDSVSHVNGRLFAQGAVRVSRRGAPARNCDKGTMNNSRSNGSISSKLSIWRNWLFR